MAASGEGDALYSLLESSMKESLVADGTATKEPKSDTWKSIRNEGMSPAPVRPIMVCLFV